jgi:hypothetical protein
MRGANHNICQFEVDFLAFEKTFCARFFQFIPRHNAHVSRVFHRCPHSSELTASTGGVTVSSLGNREGYMADIDLEQDISRAVSVLKAAVPSKRYVELANSCAETLLSSAKAQLEAAESNYKQAQEFADVLRREIQEYEKQETNLETRLGTFTERMLGAHQEFQGKANGNGRDS